MTIPTCVSCKFCIVPKDGNVNEGECAAVTDPFNGNKWPVKIARQDSHPSMNFTLTCGYRGALWQAKT